MSDGGLPDFDRNTWVSFSDLCGTKSMYRKSPDRAAAALSTFYNAVYETHGGSTDIAGLAVSDSAVFWVTTTGPGGLQLLLEHLKALHQSMVGDRYLVRSTVAYGHFKYQRRIEFPQLRKDMIIGGAYMQAFAANDKIREGAIVVLPVVGRRGQRSDNSEACPARTVADIRRHNGTLAPFIVGCREVRGREYVWWIEDPRLVSGAMDALQVPVDSRYKSLLRVYSK